MSIPGDFTFYSPRGAASPPTALRDLDGRVPLSGNESEALPPACTISVRVEYSEVEGLKIGEVTARALACPCFRGHYTSVTCRKLSDGPTEDASQWPYVASLLESGRESLNPPEEEETDELKRATKKRISESTNELVALLWEKLKIEDRPKPLTGLIVIAGRTGSGKSEIMRAFTRKYMEHARDNPQKHGGRQPHLLTYEDPIEQMFCATPKRAAECGIDYTPREKDVDVSGLEEATRDALRQTPTLFYVGETRDDKDWKELLRFAGTGHLTITTGHAGSLVETMAQVLHAADARSPAERSRVAGRIAALVHLRPEPLTGGGKVLIPAFWIRSPRSISAFTAEGLGSILPNREQKGSRDSYGRAYAVHELEYLRGIDGLKRDAVEWDLRGD